MKKTHISIHLLLIIIYISLSKLMAADWYNVGQGGFSSVGVYYPDLAIDDRNNLYIAYGRETAIGRLSVMKYNDSWEIIGKEGFSTGTPLFLNLNIDSKGTLYVGYSDASLDLGRKANVMKFTDNMWENVGPEGLSEHQAYDVNLAIDNHETLYIAYNDASSSTPTITKVKKYNGSEWISVGSEDFLVNISASYLSLKIDQSGMLYMAYCDYENFYKACVIRFDGLNWEFIGTPGFSPENAYDIQLAIDNNGTPYVAYPDLAFNNRASVMKFNGSNWEQVGTPGFSCGYVQYLRLEIDINNTPYVAYQDGGNYSKATVMKFNGSDWENVGSSGFSADMAENISLVLDGYGTPFVAYRDNYYSGKASVMYYIETNDTTSLVAYNIPKKYQIINLYPNPFNPSTTISYSLPVLSDVELAVYDLAGRKIMEWSYHNQATGTYDLTWNGKDQNGNPVPSGVYIYRMVAGDFVESRKMVLLK